MKKLELQLNEWKLISQKYRIYMETGYKTEEKKFQAVKKIVSDMKDYKLKFQEKYDPLFPPENKN